MADAAVAVALLLTRLREAHVVLREIIPYISQEAPWPVTLRINLLDLFVRHRRLQRELPPLRDTEEALGLLMMLRHLNDEEWAAQVQEIWPAIPKELVSSDGGGHEKLGVTILMGVDHGFAELQHCHEQRQPLGQSAAYQHVLQLVQALPQAQGGGWQSHKIAVQLLMFRRDQRSSLRLLGETIKMYRREDPAPIFCISHACLMQPEMNLGVEELGEIAAFQEQGCVVYPYRLASCTLPQGQCQPQLLTVLQQLFVLSTVAHETHGVNHLTVSNSTPAYWIPALLSAAHSSKSLKSISVESTFAELRESKRLLWIAYAIFRRQHQLLLLTLNCSHIEPSDVEAIQRIITAKDPLHELLSSDMTGPAKEITATRFHLADSMSSASADAENMFTSRHPMTVRVTAESVDGDGSSRVLLPGYGEAWVAQENVLDTDVGQRPSTNVMLLDSIAAKGITATSCDATIALLRVAMPGATRLEVGFSIEVSAGHIDSWLHQLLTISTDLKELQIKARAIRSLDVLLEGFTTGALRLKKLEIEKVVNGDGNHVRRFFDALGDCQHPIAAHIQQLLITIVVDSMEGYDFVESIQRMLRLNRCLTMFKIRICTMAGLEIPTGAYDRIREATSSHPVTIPLTMNSKMAFLSVVMSGSSTCSSVSQLNTSVIETIFELSASNQYRHVIVEVAVVLVGFV